MYSYQNIWKVSFPIILSLLAQNIIQITDTVLMGRVGEVEFGATGLAGIYYISYFMLAFGFSIGCQILISRRNGEQKYDKIGGIVMHAILFLLVLAGILFALSRLIADELLPQIIKSQKVYLATKEYLDWRTFGFFFSFINVSFRAFYVGITKTKVLTMNALLMAVVNFILAYGLIFGNWGMPRMGIAGAGLSSVIAEAFSVVFFFAYTRLKIDLKKYGFAFGRFQFRVIKQILHVSVFTMIQYCVSLSTWFIFFLAIESHGERALAITNLIRTFYMIFFIPMNALSTTSNTLVSNTIGAGKREQVLPLIFKICRISFAIVFLMVVATAIAPRFWIELVLSGKDPSLITESIHPLYVLLIAVPICSLGNVLFSSVSGTGNTHIGLLFEVFTITIYMAAIWWIIFYLRSSVAMCWTVEIVYWLTLMILSFGYLKWGNWQKKAI